LSDMLCTSFRSMAPPATHIYPLSLHDALPISPAPIISNTTAIATAGSKARTAVGTLRCKSPADASWTCPITPGKPVCAKSPASRSEEHTSELQSRFDLVCRLLLEKKKKKTTEQ